MRTAVLQVQAGQPAARAPQSLPQCLGRSLLGGLAARLLHVQRRHATLPRTLGA